MVWGNPPSTFSALKIFFIFFEPFHQPFPRVSLDTQTMFSQCHHLVPTGANSVNAHSSAYFCISLQLWTRN